MEFTEENSEFELDFGEIMEGGEVTGVSSVNGYTGDVVLSAQDVGAATPAQVAQTKADSQTYTDEKVAAVKEAVEAEIPTDTADLTNGAGFQNGVEVASAITSGISDHNSSATAHPAIRTQISTINSKIPAEASVSNQLADKTFVSGLVSDEASARELADTNLQGQIDAITSASDVVDVVGTYSELQAYDTQHLNDNDIVKVLVDETHDNAITYYRWTHSTTPYSWIYIGSQGPFYTKAESDTLLNEKADKSNTYTKTEVDTALAGKVDKVAGKGLSTNDFTTEEKTKLAGLENTVLESTTGQSTTAGMTQKAITDAIDNIENVNNYVIKGAGAPTTSTVGTVGKLYEDTTNGDLYQCTAVSDSTYTWEEVGGGSGSGASWGSITGTLSDQTDLQSALDDKQDTLTAGSGISIVDNVISATGGGGGVQFTDIYADGTSKTQVQLGNGAVASSQSGIAIGQSSSSTVLLGGVAIGELASAQGGVSLGYSAKSTADSQTSVGKYAECSKLYSTAIGNYAKSKFKGGVAFAQGTTTMQGEFAVGFDPAGSGATAGYNNTAYRLITGVHDGQSAHDAMTVGQANALIDAINSALSTNIAHIGASA